MGIFWSHICAVPSVLLSVGLIQRRGLGQMVRGGGEWGTPHVVSLHSDKLCSVDMSPALNKPVAAPRVEPIAQRAVGRSVRWRIKCVKGFRITRALFVVLVAYCALSHILSWAPCQALYSFYPNCTWRRSSTILDFYITDPVWTKLSVMHPNDMVICKILYVCVRQRHDGKRCAFAETYYKTINVRER